MTDALAFWPGYSDICRQPESRELYYVILMMPRHTGKYVFVVMVIFFWSWTGKLGERAVLFVLMQEYSRGRDSSAGLQHDRLAAKWSYLPCHTCGDLDELYEIFNNLWELTMIRRGLEHSRIRKQFIISFLNESILNGTCHEVTSADRCGGTVLLQCIKLIAQL
jgi:hypothetical protein